MGGGRSEEFLHPIAVGEDTFVRSAGGYAANVEAFTHLAPDPIPFDALPDKAIFDSPYTHTIQITVAHSTAVRDPPAEGMAWTHANSGTIGRATCGASV